MLMRVEHTVVACCDHSLDSKCHPSSEPPFVLHCQGLKEERRRCLVTRTLGQCSKLAVIWLSDTTRKFTGNYRKDSCISRTCVYMASDRMRKKIKDYAEIFGHIMRKHALIMQKLHRIMRKFKQVIKLIIRPVQCIYMLTVNP